MTAVTYSILTYHIPQIEETYIYANYHEVSLDEDTNEVIVNEKITIINTTRYYLHYIWKEESLFVFSHINTSITSEVFRNSNVSLSLQWVINHTTGKIYIRNGTYNLTSTIYVDSYTHLKGESETYFVFQEAPAFYIMPNSSQISFSHLNLTSKR